MRLASKPIASRFWLDAAADTPQRGSVAAPVVLAGLTAASLFALVPAATFRTDAIVAVASPTSPWAMLLNRGAADQAVSKAVIERAATSLNETSFVVTEPALTERLAVAFNIGDARPTGRVARLAEDLGRLVGTRAGSVPGSLNIVASADEPARAAEAANAVAAALIANQADVAAQTARSQQRSAGARLDELKARAMTARRRLAALGGGDADPAQARALAASQTAAAQARLDAIRAVVASGNPPIGDRRDLPPSIEALQASYLDLSRQLAKARETLGDRHTTIISLRAEVQHASSTLGAEWKRIAHVAEQSLVLAKAREATLVKTAPDGRRQDAITVARRDVELADAAVTQAQAKQDDGSAADDRGYHLIASAPVPTAATGVATPLRWGLAAIGGLAAYALASALLRRRRTDEAEETPEVTEAVDTFDDRIAETKVERRTPADILADSLSRQMMRPSQAPQPSSSRRLVRALTDLLPRIDDLVPGHGDIPTIMVAATERSVGTTDAAVALGRAAAALGRRTLVLEVGDGRAQLAATADLEADPAVIDLFGSLRVVLAADGEGDGLCVAPQLARGDEIAANLARRGAATLIDDVTASFDLLIIDGGLAASAAADGWGADAFLRVGAFASRRDDALYLASFGAASDALFATIVDGSVVEAPRPRASRPMSSMATPTAAQARAAMQPASTTPYRRAAAAPASRRSAR